MLRFYRLLSGTGKPLLNALLERRAARGKEILERLAERQGHPARPRPDGPMLWVHAASVGEAQSALILVERILEGYGNAHVLLTTGTVSSAALMEKKLPPRAIHQFYPLDHPDWVKTFLDHWRPDMVLWMESELWPNMLMEIKARNIPAVLVNARLSDRSFRRWTWIRNAASGLLNVFALILAQSGKEAERYKRLGVKNVRDTGNLKYSARPLPCDDHSLRILSSRIQARPLWVFASTHRGEEALACRVHRELEKTLPGLPTILAPRHPERRKEIEETGKAHGLNVALRGETGILPGETTDIYAADTFGELGLFYRLAPVACIGRSFSDDGGGGHNPVEAAQLGCAVLHGPNVQYQQELYDDMNNHSAAVEIRDETDLRNTLLELMTYPAKLRSYRAAASSFARSKEKVIDSVMNELEPFLNHVGFRENTRQAK